MDAEGRVLVQSRRTASAWLDHILGWSPTSRLLVRESWEVFDALAHRPFALVVVDRWSSGMPGLQLAQLARRGGYDVSFVVVSEHVDDVLRAWAARLGGVALVEEPRAEVTCNCRRTSARAAVLACSSACHIG